MTNEEALEQIKKIKEEQFNDFEEIPPEFVSSGLNLRDRFLEPPFSVLDAKTGNWQKRKKKWLDLGIKSEIGRDVVVLPGQSNNDYMPDMANGTSIFDPALCELMYTWFAPKGGNILDPYAGGSVRGIVAHLMGYKYTGIELRHEQVESNREQARAILPPDNQPTWICGDSDKVLDTLEGNIYDMIFSCPPYFNLEVYSQDPSDLSNMDYEDFLIKYQSIIKKGHYLLNNEGFEVYVVGEVRDEKGNYVDFIGDTKRCFMNKYLVGADFYNDMVLLDPIGTAMIRASNFDKNKKVVKIHQNVLCFRKR